MVLKNRKPRDNFTHVVMCYIFGDGNTQHLFWHRQKKTGVCVWLWTLV